MTPPETTTSPPTPEASSNDAQSTPAPAASLAEQALALLNDNTKNWTTATLDSLDLSLLSPEKQATLQIITASTIQGYTETELAQALGHTPSWVSELVAGMRRELLAQAAKLRPLNASERESLIRSIAAHGVKQPILIAQVDGHAAIIDGWHRYIIALRLGVITTVPWIYLGTLTREQAEELAIALNADRRQLTADQKLEIVDSQLMRHPEYTDRRIARICGVSPTTVGHRRAKLKADQATLDADTEPIAEHDDPLSTLDTRKPEIRIDARGHHHQVHPVARAPRTTPPAQEPAPTAPPARAQAEPDELVCPSCGVLLVLHGRTLRPA